MTTASKAKRAKVRKANVQTSKGSSATKSTNVGRRARVNGGAVQASKRVGRATKRGGAATASDVKVRGKATKRGGAATGRKATTKRGAAAQRAAKAVGKGRAREGAKPSKTSRPSAVKGAQASAKAERRRPQQLEFGFGRERSEVAVLQKQHRGLLLQIAKKRALITVSKQASEELMRELTERVLPYREELFEITREVCDLRERLLESSGLPKLQLERMRWALNRLLAPLPVEEAVAQELERPTDAAAEDDGEIGANEYSGAKGKASTGASESETFRAGQQRETRVASSAGGSNAANSAEAQSDVGSTEASGATSERVFGARGAAPESGERDAQSASKPTGDHSGALRALFRKLAITYHPDRVQDEVEKAARTKIMKELTSAFESTDLARLVELERTLAARTTAQSAPRETPEQQKQQLAQSNDELKRQLKELASQLRRIKDDCPFTLDLRRRDPALPARDELDQLVLNRHMEVERAAKTREFVAMFAAGRMRFADFIEGPPHLRQLSEALARFASEG